MTTNEIIAIQRKIGTTPDGIWGRKSIKACEDYLLGLMPKPIQWPRPGDAAMKAFYGEPGDMNNLINLPVDDLGVAYFGQKVKTIRCHRKVADSLRLALEEIHAGPAKHILGEYGGCFNYRQMRGGSRFSKHAWGAAIDLSPMRNGLRTHWPTKASMPFEVMEAFSRQGWTSAGAFWSRDAMHFEATSPA